jgi:hypothetical protein
MLVESGLLPAHDATLNALDFDGSLDARLVSVSLHALLHDDLCRLSATHATLNYQ